MKKTLLITLLALAAITALVWWTMQPTYAAINGEFDDILIPEGVILSTNKVRGWQVIGGTIGLYRRNNNTMLVWNKDNFASLKVVFPGGAGVNHELSGWMGVYAPGD